MAVRGARAGFDGAGGIVVYVVRGVGPGANCEGVSRAGLVVGKTSSATAGRGSRPFRMRDARESVEVNVS
jgi:hypothetical protein